MNQEAGGMVMRRSMAAIVFAMAGLILGSCSSSGGSSSNSSNTSGGGTSVPTVTVTNPTQGASLPSGPVTIVYSTANFTVGGVGQPRLRFELDGDPNLYTVVNGNDKKIFQAGVEVSEPEWLTNASFRFNQLPDGQHRLVLHLVDANGAALTNPEASTAVVFFLGVSGGAVPTIVPVSPAEGSDVASPVTVTFAVLNHTIGLPGQPHLHFYVDGDPVVHEFYNGAGIDEINGVQYQNAHTHFVHWNSVTSFNMYALGQGQHEVRFALAAQDHSELGNPEAAVTRTFNVSGASQSGEFILEPALSGLVPNGMAFTPGGGQVFMTTGKDGDVWVADIVGSTWQLRATPFFHTDVGQIGEQGMTGIAIDPNYAANRFVYLYFTTVDEQFNRLIRVTDVNGQGQNPVIILDNLLAADQHNGGVLLFGPDGKLYVTVGDATQDFLSQDSSSPNGKILRINSDGSIPSDNPFAGSPVWALGVRNSFGLAVHPVSGHLWSTDNGPSYDDEVNRIVSGGNYGWPFTTGAGVPPYIDPILTLPQPVGITNIVALAATSVYPSQYHNNLFFTDFVEGKIRRIVLDSSLTSLSSLSTPYEGGTGGLIAFQQGPDGYMYASSTDGHIYRVLVNPSDPH